MKVFKILWGFMTDAKDRPAIEALLGAAFLIGALLYAFTVKPNASILATLCSTGVALLVTNGVQNVFIDKQSSRDE